MPERDKSPGAIKERRIDIFKQFLVVLWFNRLFKSVLEVFPIVPVCFKVFDLDRDGFLSQSEMEHMVTVLLHLRSENNVELRTGKKPKFTISNIFVCL